MSEELEAFVDALVAELQATGTTLLKVDTLIDCIKRAAKEVEEGAEDGPDEGDW